MTNEEAPLIKALTIAGSDPSGGAGIQADLKTFSQLRVYGMAVIAAMTAQNTCGVSAISEVSPDFVAQQLDAVLADIRPDAVKTGMLLTAGATEAVAAKMREYRVANLVVDPVMIATSHAALMNRDALRSLQDRLLPLALVVTPNFDEAGVLAGFPVRTVADMEQAARRIHQMGPRHVLIKGGHLDDKEAIDILYDGADFTQFRSARLSNPNTHGTGCVLSAAIAAHIARGIPLKEAVGLAKEFVTNAIRCGLGIGRGTGPCDPLSLRRPNGVPD